MKAQPKDHVTFWEYVSARLEAGEGLSQTLEQAAAHMQGTPLAPAADALRESIGRGQPFSDALDEAADTFGHAAAVLMRAGEAGGMMEMASARIAQGVREEILPVPGMPADEAGDPVRLWQALSLLLAAGVPLLEALKTLRRLLSAPALTHAVGSLVEQIAQGSSLADAMHQCGEVFDPRLTATIAAGEAQGKLIEHVEAAAKALESGSLDSLERLPGGAETEEARVVRSLNKLILKAYRSRASDIHIDPTEGGTGYVRIRVDGVLRPCEELDPSLVPAMVSRAKIMSGLNLAETRLPQDGRIQLEVEGRKLDLRVSAVPALFGERIVMRLLDASTIRLELSQIMHGEAALQQVRQLCTLSHGIVISNGPTGSGKTTLMYAMLSSIDRERKCVMTVEDPVEVALEHVAQMQVRPALGLTFARALRSLLRQDPDVIMLGEIRDLETLHVCVQAALTGHLMLTSIHASTSVSAVQRLIDMGLEPYLVSATLAGVVTQRLVRRLCQACRERIEAIDLDLLPSGAQPVVRAALGGGAVFHRAAGCKACNNTGYRGREAVHELLTMDDGFRKALLKSGADTRAMFDAARAGGMQTLLERGVEMAAEGVTSLEEVMRVVPLRSYESR